MLINILKNKKLNTNAGTCISIIQWEWR